MLAPLIPFARRALGLYVGLRALLFVVSALLLALGGDPIDNAVGVVLLSAAVGMADLHRRHEALLWANLGYPPAIMALLTGTAALGGELLLALR